MGHATATDGAGSAAVARWAAVAAAVLIGLALALTSGDDQLSSPAFAIPFALGACALVVAVRHAPPWLLRGVPDLSPDGLALFRVALGIGLLATADYVRDRLPQEPLVPGQGRSDAAFFNFSLAQELAQHPRWLQAISTLTIVAVVAFLVGALPRLSFAALVAGFTLQLLGRVQFDGNHDVDLPLMAMWTMLFVPWHAAPGASSWLRRRRGRADPPLDPRARLGFAVWLPGLTLGVGLLAGAHAKLSDSGFSWISDGAVRYHFVRDAGSAPVDWGLWIAGHETLAVAMSAAAIGVEALLVVHAFLRGWRVRLALGLVAASLFASFYLFMGIRWLPWWVLLLAFVPWEQLAGALRRARGRASPAIAPAPAARAGVTLPLAATIALLVAQQVAVSAKHIEREPLLSNYPMYALTYASTGEFDEANVSAFSDYSFRTGATGADVTAFVRRVPRADSAFIDAILGAAADGSIPGRECERARRSAAGVAQRLGRPLHQVGVRVDERAFDWAQRRFVSKRSNASLGVLDLTGCTVRRDAASAL